MQLSRQMPTLSHLEPINEASSFRPPEVMLLADAFSEFISASAKLERSYVDLQAEVSHLTHELAERNTALNESLAENERVHRALEQIVDTMPCGVLVVETTGQVSLINPEARTLLGLTGATENHLQAISAAAGLDLEGFVSRHPGGEQEFCRNVAQGQRWLSVSERALLREGQTILILRDVTLHKQAEEERERARKATALAEVAATLAHEIRNPLASMELFAGLLMEGGDDVQLWAGHLQSGIRSLSAIVNNVLSFHGVGFTSLSAMDLLASLKSSVEFSRPIAAERGVHLSFTSSMGCAQVYGNSGALQQLVLNLISNAVRHTQTGGRVSVSLSSAAGADGPVARVEFSDTGCGIAPELLEEIFVAGFSGSGTTSGLGLAVCRQIAQQHDARLSVKSRPGAGTTFLLEIPTL